MSFIVPEALDGERIDRAVALLTGRSRSEVAVLVAEGAVMVDGQVAHTRAHRLHAGAVVLVDLAELPERGVQAPVADPDVELVVVHQDDDVIVIDKPPGLVVHPGAGQGSGTLAAGVLARFPEVAVVGDPLRPGIVHRLDKDTSGLLVVARSPRAYDSLVAQLARHTVTRVYLALVWGHPEPPTGVIDAPIGRDRGDPTRMAVRTDGREARTHFEVLDTFADPAPVALVECRLETGRTHQIRVHLAAIGHPVVGDDRYGGARARLVAPRVFLHARQLAFSHPGLGHEVTYESPLPVDLAEVVAPLR